MSIRKILVLMGPPGSGKGTQAALIAAHYELPHISMGSLLRKEIQEGGIIGKEAKILIEKGELVPDHLIYDLLRARLGEDDCRQGCILDGFPRTLAQAQFWVDLIKDEEMVHRVINLNVSDSLLVLRIMTRVVCEKCEAVFSHLIFSEELHQCPKCQGNLIVRADDNEETVLTRLRIYHEQTEPLLSFFAERNELKDIAAESSVEEVFEIVCLLLDKEFANGVS